MSSRSAPRWGPVPLTSAGAVAAALIGLVGFASRFTHQPWLFASLGSTVLIQAVTPDDKTARPWNAVVGHVVGFSIGIATGWIIGALAGAGYGDDAMSIWRIVIAMLAIAATAVVQLTTDSYHPPGAGTCLLIAFGPSALSVSSIPGMLLAVLLVGVFGRRITTLTRSSLRATHE